MKLALREVSYTIASPSVIAAKAVDALIAEARLTPKPALVDENGSGAHRDLDLGTMLCSANALQPTFSRSRAPLRRLGRRRPCASNWHASAAKAKPR